MRRALAVAVGGVLGALPGSVSAQTVGDSVASFGAAEWFALVLRLGLVIGVIWAAVYAMRWYTRRAGGERPSTMRTFDIVETRSLGPNRALHLVRIGERAVLIGVTPERINALMQIDDPEVLDGLELTTSGATRPSAAFGALLAGLGVGTSKPAAEIACEDASGTASLESASDVGLHDGARAAKKALRAHGPSISERVLSTLGFTPVETVQQTVARVRATHGAQAPMPVPMPIPISIPVAAAARAQSTVAPFATTAPLASFAMPSMAPIPPMPRPSLFDQIEAGRSDSGLAARIAPTATQALRALSGYAAAQQTSHAGFAASMEAVDRDDRIAEAQRAISSAQMAG
jgi:flagellar biosynthetic protein FliO